MKAHSFDYFHFFEDMIGCGCRCAKLLRDIFADYDHSKLDIYRAQMHEIERQADQHKHNMLTQLLKEFLPPIDREDIVNIGHLLDEICDCIEDVVLNLCMNDIHTCRKNMVGSGDLIVTMCFRLQEMICKFGDFKKNPNLRQYVVEINSLEEDGDRIYIDSMRKLSTDGTELRDFVVWRELYANVETCFDACEHVADALEEVILKNT